MEIVGAQGAGDALCRLGILDDLEPGDRQAHQLRQQILVQQGIETQLPVDLSGLGVAQVARQCPVVEERGGNLDFTVPGFLQFLHVDRHQVAPGSDFHTGLLHPNVK